MAENHESIRDLMHALDGTSKGTDQEFPMKLIPAALLAAVLIVGQTKNSFSQQPMLKGDWSWKNGELERVNFDYGTELTAKDIRRVSAFGTIAHLYMGYAGVDSEYVTIEGKLLRLGRLSVMPAQPKSRP